MAPVNSRLIHFILVLLALIPLVYGIRYWSESANTIGQNIMASWLATMIGAGVGVLIGLEVDRWQQGREQMAKKEETSCQETQVLNAILRELMDNRKALAARREKMPQERSILLGLTLKDELWNALSDGGELRWITDLTLLESIAAAYHHIRSVVFIEEEIVRKTGALTVPIELEYGPDVGDEFKSALIEADAELDQAVERTISAMTDRLQKDPMR
jgi:hypothetical protein